MCLEERFYIVDEDDNVLGWAYRSECHRKRLIHRSVYVVVLNDRGEIFIQRRSMSKDLYPGLYACSVSGHVKYGESYEEAARRELMEELGIDTEVEFIGKFKSFSRIECEISALYLCRYNGPIKINSEEISGGKFVGIDDVKRMVEYEGEKIAYGSILALREFIRYIERNYTLP